MTAKSLRLDHVSKNDEDKAREMLEKLRWPDGIACPRCGSVWVSKITAKLGSKHPVRRGVYRCQDCRKMKNKDQFTVTVGTIFEDSHIKLSIWLMAISLMCASKKGISAHQLHRMLGITYKSAWFMAHRIRYAMAQPSKKKMRGTIEIDETYIGGRKRGSGKVGAAGMAEKAPVVALVQRNGEVRSYAVPVVSAQSLREIIFENVHPSASIMTDELAAYKKIGKEFASHETVQHSKLEYVRGNVSTNTVEGFFGLFKRGVNGTFHHISKEHLHRYLSEFDFRYNRREITDSERTAQAIRGFEGKRLTYRDSLS